MVTVRNRARDLLETEPAKQIRKFAVNWRSYCDPPLEWYRAFTSMKYTIEPVFSDKYQRLLHLTPVPDAVVYTFDTKELVIVDTRDFEKNVLFNDLVIYTEVAMYRSISGPPREHYLYSLPPFWNYGDGD